MIYGIYVDDKTDKFSIREYEKSFIDEAIEFCTCITDAPDIAEEICNMYNKN